MSPKGISTDCDPLDLLDHLDPGLKVAASPAMSHFAFLRAEWPGVHEAAARAEAAALPDPRTACFYARRALELLVHWVYKHDPALRLPYQDNLSALIHEP